MRILFINPNRSQEFTQRIRQVVARHAVPSTEVVCMNPSTGPQAIGGAYDELLSAQSTLELVIPELGNFEAFAIACYSDHPIIAALRELTSKPVMGIAEASMYMACMVGHTFGIVTTNKEWCPLLWNAVRQYGLTQRCVSIRATNWDGAALQALPRREATCLVREVAQRIVTEDGANVICLGGAVMTGMDRELRSKLGLPVIDGVVSALKLLEALLSCGLQGSQAVSRRAACSDTGACAPMHLHRSEGGDA